MKRAITLSTRSKSILAFCAAATIGGCTLAPRTTNNLSAGIYNIRDFGAKGDGKTLDHDAINHAIDTAASHGGGTVDVPPGHYLCGSIHLKSNIELHLAAGARIIGAPQNLNAYDAIEPFNQSDGKPYPLAYQDSGHCYFHNSLIWGENLHDISITGPGMIDGGGLVSSDRQLEAESGFRNFGRPQPSTARPSDTMKSPIRLGNKAIAMKLCRNVTIKDITIFHGGHFAILITGNNGTTIDNVTMDTNRDGIDIDACQNTIMSNSRVNSPNDDGICPKASFALGETRVCENLTITNCIVSGWKEGTLLDGTMQPSKSHNGRIKLGTESSGGFRNVTISNCVFRDCKGLALEQVDGAIMDDIAITNITMVNVFDYAIYVTTGTRNRTGGLNVGEELGSAKNILISNIVATNAGPMAGIEVMGTPSKPIENLRLQNILLTSVGGKSKEDGEHPMLELGQAYPEPSRLGTASAYGVYVRHAKNFQMRDVSVKFTQNDERPPLVAIDVDGMWIDGFQSQIADGIKAGMFEAVKNERITESPVLEKFGAIVRSDAVTPVATSQPRLEK